MTLRASNLALGLGLVLPPIATPLLQLRLADALVGQRRVSLHGLARPGHVLWDLHVLEEPPARLHGVGDRLIDRLALLERERHRRDGLALSFPHARAAGIDEC